MSNKCAPGKTFSEGSCFTLDELKEIANSYNKENTNKKITIRNDKRILLKQLNNRLKEDYDCNDQLCWLDTKIVKKINNKKINFFTFRPNGPEKKHEWLSTTNINDVMYQYENKYKDFKFLGAVPYDFEELSFLDVYNLNFNDLLNQNKTKIGMVVNLDEHYKSGSHWVGVYADLKNKNVYYFDSFAKRPRKRIKKFFGKILSYLYEKNYNKTLDYETILEQHSSLDNFDVRYNKIQHQLKDSECGVYSMNFIIRLLNNESFDDIVNNVTRDDEMNKCRSVYFR